MSETSPIFKVTKVGKDHYGIEDETGNIFGTYATKKEAEKAAEDWRIYYSSPLP